MDPGGRPLAGVAFRLRFGAEPIDGTTTGEGFLEAHLPATLTEVTALAWVDGGDPDDEAHATCFAIALGHLDPIETESGVEQRLRNLGYASSAAGMSDEEKARALRAFQTDAGLTATGVVDASTRRTLVDGHGAV